MDNTSCMLFAGTVEWDKNIKQVLLETYYYLFVEDTFDFGGTLAYALRILKNQPNISE